MKQQDLDNYFSSKWTSNINQYQYSGWSLIEKIALGELVLDVGCGPNPFKGKIEHLVGIDPAHDEADHKCTIEEFHSDIKFDVAFCLGSINFGSEETIIKQIECVVNLLKPHSRIYWRCNPGLQDHGNLECKDIDFYPWDLEKHTRLSSKFNYQLSEFKKDSNNRIFAEWTRQSII